MSKVVPVNSRNIVVNSVSPKMTSVKRTSSIINNAVNTIKEEYDFDVKKQNVDESSKEYKLSLWRQKNENEYIVNGKIDKVPLFYQTDFDYIPYSQANVYSSGCGITSLAMVASYLNDKIYSPGELAETYNSSASNNIERMENAARDLELSYEYTTEWNEIRSYLENGKVGIILFTGASDFSPSSDGHFAVLTGITDEGRILVNDPYEINYSNNSLINGFTNGFDDWQIYTGYVGAWFFDKNTGTKIIDNTVNGII